LLHLASLHQGTETNSFCNRQEVSPLLFQACHSVFVPSPPRRLFVHAEV
jgi:hypothetical protein